MGNSWLTEATLGPHSYHEAKKELQHQILEENPNATPEPPNSHHSEQIKQRTKENSISYSTNDPKIRLLTTPNNPS